MTTIASANIDTENPTPLFDGRWLAFLLRLPLLDVWQVAWSPRRGQLLISRGADAPSLQLVRPDGRGLRTLRRAPLGEASLNPKWSPDGRRIVYEHWTGCANGTCDRAETIEIADLRGNVLQSLGKRGPTQCGPERKQHCLCDRSRRLHPVAVRRLDAPDLRGRAQDCGYGLAAALTVSPPVFHRTRGERRVAEVPSTSRLRAGPFLSVG
jgi:hypothetical protein